MSKANDEARAEAAATGTDVKPETTPEGEPWNDAGEVELPEEWALAAQHGSNRAGDDAIPIEVSSAIKVPATRYANRKVVDFGVRLAE